MISHILHKHSIVSVYYVYEVYAVMTICNQHADSGRSPRELSGKDSVNVGTPYHRTKYIIFWVRIPVEPLITYFWKVKIKGNENSAWQICIMEKK